MISPQFLEVGLAVNIYSKFTGIFGSLLTEAPFVPFFYGLKLLHHHLERFRKLKGKVKKDEKPGWNASRGLRIERYALLYFLPWIDFFFIFVKE